VILVVFLPLLLGYSITLNAGNISLIALAVTQHITCQPVHVTDLAVTVTFSSDKEVIVSIYFACMSS